MKCTYHVLLSSGSQERSNVPLDVLRPPLQSGEKVSMYVSKGNKWVNAVVFGEQSAAATTLGYKLRFTEDNAQDFPWVPPTRIRRRFAQGDKVIAYNETTFKWESGTVSAAAQKNARWATDKKGSKKATAAEAAKDGGRARGEMPKDQNGEDIELLTSVPVVFAAGGNPDYYWDYVIRSGQDIPVNTTDETPKEWALDPTESVGGSSDDYSDDPTDPQGRFGQR